MGPEDHRHSVVSGGVTAFGLVVSIEQLLIQSPLGSFQRSHSPANANSSPSLTSKQLADDGDRLSRGNVVAWDPVLLAGDSVEVFLDYLFAPRESIASAHGLGDYCRSAHRHFHNCFHTWSLDLARAGKLTREI